jgi:hypothetical protein
MTPAKAMVAHSSMTLGYGKRLKIHFLFALKRFTLEASYETFNLSAQLELLIQGQKNSVKDCFIFKAL